MSEMTGGPISVWVDAELEDLVPGFLSNRRQDVGAIQRALLRADYAAIQTIGHDMKGFGAGYGFVGISDLGRELEDAARRQDVARIGEIADAVASYLDRVDVLYG